MAIRLPIRRQFEAIRYPFRQFAGVRVPKMQGFWQFGTPTVFLYKFKEANDCTWGSGTESPRRGDPPFLEFYQARCRELGADALLRTNKHTYTDTYINTYTPTRDLAHSPGPHMTHP